MAKTSKSDEVRPIIVKKVKKVAGGHHGGAWKVAYADFVTAMMAFFLLLWLLNVVTSQALQTISDYFDPTVKKISQSQSGAGGLMGGTTVSPVGAMTSTVQPMTQPQPTGMAGQVQTPARVQSEANNTARKLEEELRKEEDASFQSAKAEMEKEIAQNPDLQALAKNLMVDITPEGLRIQLVDSQGKPMFPTGSAEMYDYTRRLAGLVAKVILKMPNDISVRGHTDSHPYPPGARYTNWELSADRANATRREFSGDGVPDTRIKDIMGRADRDPLDAKDPADPRNRRISVILLRESVEHAAERGAFGEVFKPTQPAPEESAPLPPPQPYQKSEGAVYFP